MNNMSYISCLVLAVLVFWIGFALKRCPSALRVLRRDVLAVLLVFAVAASLVADKTNGLMRIIGQLRSPAPVAVTVTTGDVARGWRVESVSTNETMSYEMPTNATYVGNWHVHGARSSFGNNKIDFSALRASGTLAPTGWSFPIGTNTDSFSSFWYFVDGRIRPTPRDAAREIRAAGGPMFAMPGASRLWTAGEADGSQSLTWENFFIGEGTNTPVNAQIRLYENGDFTTSSNELVTVCRRVEPFDWDGDGLANTIDPNPCTGSTDCHGTCAAWYNIACSNLLTAVDGDYGVLLTWRSEVNQNAYYFVEVVAESGPAQIVFSASQAGNLGSPVIVAHAGETNTVPLLVGVEYSVTSTAPCTSECTCGGSCTATGSYGYEGLSFPVTGGECRCEFNDTERPAMPQSEGPCVSVAFSDSAVIFEDSYQESPGVWKPKRSTRTWLTIYANGGPNGGLLSVSLQNLEKISPVACGPVVLPSTLNLAANETYSAQYLFEAGTPSGATNDISVTASLLPSGQSEAIESNASLTSVKVELEAVNTAPENPCANRHTYGVGELVRITATPSLQAIALTVVRGNTSETNLVVVEPQSVICRGAGLYGDANNPFVCLPTGSVGGMLLRTSNYIGPMNVSFEGIMVAEIPCEEVIPPTGYYATTNYTGPLSHTMAAQAGHAFRVKPGNYWANDVAGRRTAYENWSEGRMEWKIPIGWVRMLDQNGNPRNVASPDYEQCGNANSRPLLIGDRTDAYKQIFTISQFGTAKIEKHRHWLSRSILCVITLDGDIIQWSH